MPHKDPTQRAAYFAANKEKIAARKAAWCAANKEKIAAQRAAYRAANAEKIAARKAAYYAANKEKVAARSAAWYAANAEKIAAHGATYYAANAEKIAARHAAWTKANPDKHNAKSARRRAVKLRATPAWADQDAITAVYAEAQRYADLGLEVHVDHYYPLQGETVSGLHVHQNLRVILADDNLKKQNRHPDHV